MMANLILLFLGTFQPPSADIQHFNHPACDCAVSKLYGGWCKGCGVGYLAGIEIKSADMFEALDAHGHDIMPERIRCQRCREAIPKDGYCKICRMGFVNKLAYLSRLTYLLAQGEPRALELPKPNHSSRAHHHPKELPTSTHSHAHTSQTPKTQTKTNHTPADVSSMSALHSTQTTATVPRLFSSSPKESASPRATPLTCHTCRNNAKQSGWCPRCQIGMVGNVAFKDPLNYGEASRELLRLLKAMEKLDDCETCAVAAFTGGRCTACMLKKRSKLQKAKKLNSHNLPP